MKRQITLFLMSACFIFTALGSYGHSFSTSFLTVQENGLFKYQVSFHDLAALNPSWLEGKPIDAQLLNSHLDQIEEFIQRVVVVNQTNCQLGIVNGSPWSAVTHANENYIVIKAQAQCDASNIEHIEVTEVWNEFPDHRVIAQINLPEHEQMQVVLSEDNNFFSFVH